MHIVKDDNDRRLAFKFGKDDIPKGLNFFSDDNDFIQIGTWNYDKGKQLLAHIHNEVPRQSLRTQEFIFLVQGSLKASIYDENEKHVEDVIVGVNEGMVMLAGAHGYEILEEDTIVIESKNGPYVGAEADRRRIE